MANINILDYIQNVSTQTFRKGEIIFKQNDVSNGSMYFIFQGEVAIIVTRGESNDKVRTMIPGEFFGEMALVSSQKRAATVIAQSDLVKLGIIHKDTFVKISKTNPSFLFLLLRTVVDRMISMEAKLNKCLAEKAKDENTF